MHNDLRGLINKMFVYHQVDSSSVDSVMRHGLKVKGRGEDGQDDAIIKADNYLDNHRPASIIEARISRKLNSYGYVAIDGDRTVQITDGTIISITELMKNESRSLLKIHVDPSRCYVSNLEAFDSIKQAIVRGEDENVLAALQRDYWQQVISLDQFVLGQFKRPEVMITYDVAAQNIELCMSKA